MRQLTIRGVTDDLARALEQARKQRGSSLNQTVLELLRQGLGLSSNRFDNGLSKLAGTWTKKEFHDFEKNVAAFNQVDEEIWK
jgi:hypothetical protein